MVSLFAHRRFEHNQVTIKRNSFPRQPHYNFICNLKKTGAQISQHKAGQQPAEVTEMILR